MTNFETCRRCNGSGNDGQCYNCDGKGWIDQVTATFVASPRTEKYGYVGPTITSEVAASPPTPSLGPSPRTRRKLGKMKKVSVKDLAAKRKGKRSTSSPSEKQQKLQRKACPACGELKANLTAHMAAKHGGQQQETTAVRSNLPNAQRLAGNAHNQRPAQTPAASRKQGKGLKRHRCRHCNKMVVALYAHVLAMHPGAGSRKASRGTNQKFRDQRVRASKAPAKKAKTTRGIPVRVREAPPIEDGTAPDARDAKKYWGNSFRDKAGRGGEFGSYPVHDGFDDNSEP